jgi:hypothetical protein
MNMMQLKYVPISRAVHSITAVSRSDGGWHEMKQMLACAHGTFFSRRIHVYNFDW